MAHRTSAPGDMKGAQLLGNDEYAQTAQRPRARTFVDETRRAVQFFLPPFSAMTDEQARAVLEEAISLRHEWERKGYATRR